MQFLTDHVDDWTVEFPSYEEIKRMLLYSKQKSEKIHVFSYASAKAEHSL